MMSSRFFLDREFNLDAFVFMDYGCENFELAMHNLESRPHFTVIIDGGCIINSQVSGTLFTNIYQLR